MSLDNVILIEEGVLRRLVKDTGVAVTKEEVIYLNYEGNLLVSIHPRSKYAEFSEDWRDPLSHDPVMKPLIGWLEQERYETNLK